MICKICNKEIGNKGFSSHIKSHNISDKEYYDKYCKSELDGYCKICNKKTKFLGAVRGYATYCGNKCAQKDPVTREKYKTTCIKLYGVENVFQSDIIKEQSKQTCFNHYGVEYPGQSVIIQNKVKQSKLQKYGDLNYNNRNKAAQTNLNKYGYVTPIHNPDIWKKAIKSMKNNGNYSKIEDYFEQLCIDKNIKYISQYSDIRYPYHCDFYLPDYDLFIELNVFWHHGGMIFNITDTNCINQLNKWSEKAKMYPQYVKAIEVWTQRDVEKYKCAKINKLNYIILWNKKDIDIFMQAYK